MRSLPVVPLLLYCALVRAESPVDKLKAQVKALQAELGTEKARNAQLSEAAQGCVASINSLNTAVVNSQRQAEQQRQQMANETLQELQRHEASNRALVEQLNQKTQAASVDKALAAKQLKSSQDVAKAATELSRSHDSATVALQAGITASNNAAHVSALAADATSEMDKRVVADLSLNQRMSKVMLNLQSLIQSLSHLITAAVILVVILILNVFLLLRRTFMLRGPAK